MHMRDGHREYAPYILQFFLLSEKIDVFQRFEHNMNKSSEFKQMMKEATHIKGRIIDHFYFKPGKGISEKVSIFRYSPYYSDHDATCATVTKIDSQLRN